MAPLYLTFVNPHPVKGLFVFARIAEQIARRRPEIPILVVDSRARGSARTDRAGSELGQEPLDVPRIYHPTPSIIPSIGMHSNPSKTKALVN